MAEMILRATGSKLKIISEIHVTSTQAQYDTCLFEFDKAWDGYGLRTAAFYSHPKNIKAMVLDTNNRCFIPWDAFSHSRYLYIGVYGSNGESYIPTQFVEVMYQPGANVDDHLYPPTPGIYEQIAASYSLMRQELSGKADQEDVNSAVARLEGSKAEKSAVQDLATQMASLGSGSPKGTYNTLAALQTAKPSGDSGIYVVTADGKWYYWDGAAWIAGGVYQSTGLSVALENRTIKAGMMVTGEISELTREAMTGAVVVSTPTNIYIYSGSTNIWAFNKITNLSIPDSCVLYADLSLSPHNVSGVVHDLQVGTISNILWTDDSKLPLLVNRWHRLSGHLLKQGITTLEKLPVLEAENTLRKDNYVVVGELSSANISSGVESVSISTPLSVFVYDGKGKYWRFEQQTNVVIPSNYGLFADVSVPDTTGEDAYPMSVMSLSSAKWANEKLLH